MKRLLSISILLLSLQFIADSQVIFKRPITARLSIVHASSGGGITMDNITFDSASFASTLPTSDLKVPGKGFEHWNTVGWDNISAIRLPDSANTSVLSAYDRLSWFEIEPTTQGNYDWSLFDSKIRAAISGGKKFSFGIMSMCQGCSPNIDGSSPGGMGYPTYVHAQMQADVTNNRDWRETNTSQWVPNWNSPFYQAAWLSLLQGIANHIDTGSYLGKAYKDVISYIDVRGYGSFGEWHNYNYYWMQPTGRTATVASLKALIDAHITAFPNYPLAIISAAYDEFNASLVPPEVGYYALTVSNNWGRIGWRRDNWGAPGSDNHLKNNSSSYTGKNLKDTIMIMYKYAPILGEPTNDPGEVGVSGSAPYHWDLMREIVDYGALRIGNGNIPGLGDYRTKQYLRYANQRMGFRIVFHSGSISSTITRDVPFTVNIGIRNIGITPLYDDWKLVYDLRNGSNVTVWSDTSSIVLKKLPVSTTARTITDVMTIPSSVANGTYTLRISLKDANGYWPVMPTYTVTPARQSDNSHIIKTITF